MGLFSSLIDTVVDVAITPIKIIDDVINVGDGESSKTVEHLEKIEDDIEKVIDDLL